MITRERAPLSLAGSILHCVSELSIFANSRPRTKPSHRPGLQTNNPISDANRHPPAQPGVSLVDCQLPQAPPSAFSDWFYSKQEHFLDTLERYMQKSRKTRSISREIPMASNTENLRSLKQNRKIGTALSDLCKKTQLFSQRPQPTKLPMCFLV